MWRTQRSKRSLTLPVYMLRLFCEIGDFAKFPVILQKNTQKGYFAKMSGYFALVKVLSFAGSRFCLQGVN